MVDSGYANTSSFLAPYRGNRYHIGDFGGSRRRHRNPKDLFNHHHAQLRNVVERAFGVLKAHFHMLNKVPCYPYKTQCLIVIACCKLHNYLRKEQRNDNVEPIPLDSNLECGDEDPHLDGLVLLTQLNIGDNLRRHVVNQLWANK